MTPEQFIVGARIEYKGEKHPEHLGVVQTILSVQGRYGEVRTDFFRNNGDVWFDKDSQYAKNCILISSEQETKSQNQ